MPDPLEVYDGPKITLYTRGAFEVFAQKANTSVTDRFELARSKELLQILWERGKYRKLATVPHFHRKDIEHFKKSFPNFTHVVEFIAGACEVAKLKDNVMRMTPILLSGPPGVGKQFSQKQSRAGSIAAFRFLGTIQHRAVAKRPERLHSGRMLSQENF